MGLRCRPGDSAEGVQLYQNQLVNGPACGSQGPLAHTWCPGLALGNSMSRLHVKCSPAKKAGESVCAEGQVGQGGKHDGKQERGWLPGWTGRSQPQGSGCRRHPSLPEASVCPGIIHRNSTDQPLILFLHCEHLCR